MLHCRDGVFRVMNSAGFPANFCLGDGCSWSCGSLHLLLTSNGRPHLDRISVVPYIFHLNKYVNLTIISIRSMCDWRRNATVTKKRTFSELGEKSVAFIPVNPIMIYTWKSSSGSVESDWTANIQNNYNINHLEVTYCKSLVPFYPISFPIIWLHSVNMMPEV